MSPTKQKSREKHKHTSERKSEMGAVWMIAFFVFLFIAGVATIYAVFAWITYSEIGGLGLAYYGTTYFVYALMESIGALVAFFIARFCYRRMKKHGGKIDL